MPPHIALITPMKNEEKYIEGMLRSILEQEVKPDLWVIVDDGSTDGTPEILQRYCLKAPFIQVVQLPQRSVRRPGGEGAIASGMERISVPDFDFIARFDADLLFERSYFARILSEFARDDRLGIAGGGLYVEQDRKPVLERAPGYHVRGALKMYRRECFEQLGGLGTEIGWDTIDEVMAWSFGWKTRSFPEIAVIHRRPTGSGLNAARVFHERGRAEYLTWSHPVFAGLKTVGMAARSPVNAWNFAGGMIASYRRRDARIQAPAFRRARRKQQLDRMLYALFPAIARKDTTQRSRTTKEEATPLSGL